MTLFGGPNGSGKSTIINYIRANNLYPDSEEAYHLNADDLERHLKQKPHCGLTQCNIRPSRVEWETFIRDSTLSLKICTEKQLTVEELITGFPLVHNGIVIRPPLEPDSYIAALIIDFIRRELINTGQSFTFETVMSSADKIDIMRRAKKAGFLIRLYYVTTRDPDINVVRVESRVQQKGHPVAENKIRSRYIGSLENLADALRLADEAFLFDNSTDGVDGIEVARKIGPELTVQVEEVPDWYITYVERKFI